MAKRYVKTSIPVDTWKLIKLKNIRMNNTLQNLGVKKRIPLTRMIDAIAKRTIWFDDQELINLARNKRKTNGHTI